MKFAANISSLWSELPYLDRFNAAAAAGFEGVAVPLPYEMPGKDTYRASLASGLPVVQISAPPPNYTGGARGFAAVPGQENRFRYDLRRALRYCEVLRVPVLHLMAGLAEGAAAHQTLVSNLRHAVAMVPEGIVLTLEPQAQEGAFLNSYLRAAEVIAEIGAPNLGLQFHSHHAHLLEGDAVEEFERHASIVRHIQLGDAPKAGPFGTGAIDLPALLGAIGGHNYTGWLVADYPVTGATEDSLAWFKAVQS